MVVWMKTTINLPDSLAESAKQRAAAEGRTFTSLIEEGLRTVLAAHPSAEKRKQSGIDPLPTYGSEGGRALVDLEDRDAVWAALDADGQR